MSKKSDKVLKGTIVISTFKVLYSMVPKIEICHQYFMGKKSQNQLQSRGSPHYADFGTSKKLRYAKFALVGL